VDPRFAGLRLGNAPHVDSGMTTPGRRWTHRGLWLPALTDRQLARPDALAIAYRATERTG
jgi:hypothetical protein